MSARTRTSLSGRRSTKYLSPSAKQARRRINSGDVSRRRFACITRRTVGELAHESPKVPILIMRPSGSKRLVGSSDHRGAVTRTRTQFDDVSPSAARLIGSLRDIGYDFNTALADLVDNSISAGAGNIDIEIVYAGADSYVMLADDGDGMSANQTNEAFRFGSRRDYARGQLGRYGLGLKTASLSQARRLTVVTRRQSDKRSPTVRRCLDLDVIDEHDAWLVTAPAETDPVRIAADRLREQSGTVVVWEVLDRVIPLKRAEHGHTRRRMQNLTEKLKAHLAMVFHRFLTGDAVTGRVNISVGGEKLEGWDPFALDEPATRRMPSKVFDLRHDGHLGQVRLDRFVLPHRDSFSAPERFEELSGPLKWNRQQGLYVYRADRLVQWGGWGGIRAIDEHTKLARAALYFDTDLDAAFNINVAKMRVQIPSELRGNLEDAVRDLCLAAQGAYRRSETGRGGRASRGSSAADVSVVGVAIRLAAIDLGCADDLERVLDLVADRDAKLADALRSTQ